MTGAKQAAFTAIFLLLLVVVVSFGACVDGTLHNDNTAQGNSQDPGEQEQEEPVGGDITGRRRYDC